MKNKIYGKLFHFCDPKSWTKRQLANDSTAYSSVFYPEYKLEFKCDGMFWLYYIYKKHYYNNSYEESHCFKGIVTFNKSGKMLFSLIPVAIFLFITKVLLILPFNIFLLSVISIISIILSFFILSIFNFKIYRSLKKAQNCEKLKLKEEHEKLDKEVVQIVNKAIANNPKLARKQKLIELKKKWFWQK